MSDCGVARPKILVAWRHGDIGATFVWDPALTKVKRSGEVIVTRGRVATKAGKVPSHAGHASTRVHQGQRRLGQFMPVLAQVHKTHIANRSVCTTDSPAVQDAGEMKRLSYGESSVIAQLL